MAKVKYSVCLLALKGSGTGVSVSGSASLTGKNCSDGLNPIKYVDVAASDIYKPFFQFAPIPQTTLTRRHRGFRTG